MSNIRIYKFDTLKAIAMVGVVLLHAYCLLSPGPIYLRKPFAMFSIGVFMFLFSIMSGWVIKPSKWNWRTIIRLLLLAFVVNLLINHCEIVFVGSPNRTYISCAVAMWYVCVLLSCKLIFPLFKNQLLLLVLSLLLSWTSFLLPSCFNFNPLHRFIGFVPFFAFGYLIGNDNRLARLRDFILSDSHTRTCRILLVGFMVLMIATQLTPWYQYFWEYIRNCSSFIDKSPFVGGGRVLSHLFFLLLCVLWFKSIPSRELVITKYGKRTLAVYLLHMIPLFACAGFVKATPRLWHWYWHYPIMTIGVAISFLAFSQCVYRLFLTMVAGSNKVKICEMKELK